MKGFAILIVLAAALLNPEISQGQDPYAAKRRQMVADIEAMARYTAAETGRPVFKAEVMSVMAKMPRHQFVPWLQRAFAYDNRPLPIGFGQTISQPYIVALMTDLLDAKRSDRILEIGTGSGYQAAVLAELVQTVFTIEIVEGLGKQAAETLKSLGYANVRTRIGDGYRGWPEEAPFDGILVTAAASEVPEPLVFQLKAGGRLVIPVGARSGAQWLLVIEKQTDGTIRTRKSLPVRFVPLVGGK